MYLNVASPDNQTLVFRAAVMIYCLFTEECSTKTPNKHISSIIYFDEFKVQLLIFAVFKIENKMRNLCILFLFFESNSATDYV